MADVDRTSLAVLGKVSHATVLDKNPNGEIWVNALSMAEQTVLIDVSIPKACFVQ
jgi:hypothetical protein